MLREEKTESIIVSIASGHVTVIVRGFTVIILLYKLEYMIKNLRGLIKILIVRDIKSLIFNKCFFSDFPQIASCFHEIKFTHKFYVIHTAVRTN